MESPAIFDDHKKEIAAAEAFYFGLGRVWCPALDDFVHFEKLGFRHLLQKGRKFRIKSEQHRRKDENAIWVLCACHQLFFADREQAPASMSFNIFLI